MKNMKNDIKNAKNIEKTKQKKLTPKAKETLFEANRELLEVLYYIGGGITLKEHLISLMSFFYPLKTNLKNNINELIESGFLKEQQFLISNKYFVYMTKYPIAKLQGIKSRNANDINPSYEKMANSLFRMEYFIMVLSPKIPRKNATIERVREICFDYCHTVFTGKSNPEKAYYSFITTMKRFEKIEVSNFFKDEYKSAIHDKEVLFNRIYDKEIVVNESYKKSKEKIQAEKATRITANEKMRDFFNFKNLLSRNFAINGVKYENNEFIVKLSLFDLNNTLEVIYIYKNLGYIYQMFDRYLNLPVNVDLKINLTVYTWSLDRSNLLKHESTQKAREFGTGGFKKENKATYALLESGLQNNQIKSLKVDFKTFDFDKKYGLVK